MVMISQIISYIINVEFEISSLQTNKSSCSIECKKTNGHMPYFYEGMRISKTVKVMKAKSIFQDIFFEYRKYNTVNIIKV